MKGSILHRHRPHAGWSGDRDAQAGDRSGERAEARKIRELVSDDPEKVLETVSTGLDQLERKDAPAILTALARAWSDGRMGLLESYPEWCECVTTPAERREYARMIDGRNPGIARSWSRKSHPASGCLRRWARCT